MTRSTAKNKMVLSAVLLFLLAFVPMVCMDCKKKEKPEDTQQVVESRETKQVSDSQKTDTSEKIGLRILYVGSPASERQKDFTEFLSRHFAQITTIDNDAFTEDQTAEFDVTILDQEVKVHWSYTSPIVTIGSPGADICSRLSLKTGYL